MRLNCIELHRDTSNGRKHQNTQNFFFYIRLFIQNFNQTMTLPLLNFENHQMQDALYIEEEIKRNKIKQREELTSNVQSSYFLSLSPWVSQETNRSRATRTETLIKEKSSNSRNFSESEREKVHDGNAGGDLGPKVVDQIVEVGERVELERGVRLVQHRQ